MSLTALVIATSLFSASCKLSSIFDKSSNALRAHQQGPHAVPQTRPQPKPTSKIHNSAQAWEWSFSCVRGQNKHGSGPSAVCAVKTSMGAALKLFMRWKQARGAFSAKYLHSWTWWKQARGRFSAKCLHSWTWWTRDKHAYEIIHLTTAHSKSDLNESYLQVEASNLPSDFGNNPLLCVSWPALFCVVYLHFSL
jgi:hypothetical protein